ncbi:MAG: c-type cytochrome [Myxococcota bacterium]
MKPFLLSFLCLLAGACNKPPQLANPSEAPVIEEGARLYARYCALCHGEDREGYAADYAPSLRSPELLGAAPQGYLWTAISYGRPGTAMAAFAEQQGGPLTQDNQRTLYEWLLDASDVPREPVEDATIEGNPELGAAVYQSHCAACHGEDGAGGTGTALANQVFLATASDTFIRHTVVHGRSGTPMLGFADRLSEDEVNGVVAFLRSRSVGWDAPPPVRVRPPEPADAVLHPNAPPAQLDHREDRFVSAASVALALKRGERIVLLDARPMSDWQRSHLPGALPVPFYDGVDAIRQHLPTDGTPIVAYCACPHAASGRVVDALKEHGFAAARILDEGVLHWAAQGYPLAIGKGGAP